MSKKIYWIDDAFDGQALPDELEREAIKETLGASVVPEKRIENREQFLDLIKGIAPHETMGVVMDYQLRKVESGGGDTKGSVWAAEIRFKHPSVPVVGVSHEEEDRIPDFQLENFLEFFPRSRLAEPDPEYANLKALFLGYSHTFNLFSEGSSKDGLNILVDLVDAPAEVSGTLSDAIPSRLRGKWDEETPHLASRWIWHELQGRPGFLLDSLEAATILGLNKIGFIAVENYFSNARYRGAFASDQKKRWWIPPIREIASSIIGEKLLGPVAHHREKLLGAVGVADNEKSTLLSKPFAVADVDEKNRIPNCVAFPDEATRDLESRIQTFHGSTIVLEMDAGQPFGFEPRRTFRANLD